MKFSQHSFWSDIENDRTQLHFKSEINMTFNNLKQEVTVPTPLFAKIRYVQVQLRYLLGLNAARTTRRRLLELDRRPLKQTRRTVTHGHGGDHKSDS